MVIVGRNRARMSIVFFLRVCFISCVCCHFFLVFPFTSSLFAPPKPERDVAVNSCPSTRSFSFFFFFPRSRVPELQVLPD